MDLLLPLSISFVCLFGTGLSWTVAPFTNEQPLVTTFDGCQHGYVRCYNDTKCNPLGWVCDGIKDCDDNSDEVDCHRKTTYKPYDPDHTTPEQHEQTTLSGECPEGHVKCYNDSKCNPMVWLCDGYKDCSDNSDEIDCHRKPTYPPHVYEQTTDGLHHQDEEHLTTKSGECQPEFVRCYNSTKCYPRSWVCDSYKDCDDSSDEVDCHRKPNYRSKKPAATTVPQRPTTKSDRKTTRVPHAPELTTPGYNFGHKTNPPHFPRQTASHFDRQSTRKAGKHTTPSSEKHTTRGERVYRLTTKRDQQTVDPRQFTSRQFPARRLTATGRTGK